MSSPLEHVTSAGGFYYDEYDVESEQFLMINPSCRESAQMKEIHFEVRVRLHLTHAALHFIHSTDTS